jgi:hypothetical protein
MPGVPDNQYFELYDLMKNFVGSDDPGKMISTGGNDMINTYPVHKVSIPVDKQFVLKNGTVNATDSVVGEVRFDIPKDLLMKNDLAVLNVLAANKWKRPIYFTSAFNELGFAEYLRKDGLTYRFVPVVNEQVNTEWMKDKLMNKFAFGGANRPGVYFDEENRRHLNTIRSAYAELAFDLSAKNRKEEARTVLGKVDKMMLQENFPYGMISRGNQHNRNSLAFLEACYRADDKQLADKVMKSVRTDLQQQLKFYNSLSGSKAEWMSYDKRSTEELLQVLARMESMLGGKPATEGGQNVIQPAEPRAKPDNTTAPDTGASFR